MTIRVSNFIMVIDHRQLFDDKLLVAVENPYSILSYEKEGFLRTINLPHPAPVRDPTSCMHSKRCLVVFYLHDHTEMSHR